MQRVTKTFYWILHMFKQWTNDVTFGGDVNVVGNLDIAGKISNLLEFDSDSVTISGGEITATAPIMIVAAESGTADDLDTINPTDAGKALVCIQVAGGHTITVKYGTGNIYTSSGADIVMSDPYENLWLYKRSSSHGWQEFNSHS